MVPRDQVGIWSLLKNCIGKELYKITMPVVFNEPLTLLQRTCENIQHSQYLKLADDSKDPVERMELVCAFIIAGLSNNCHRLCKPFNPLLYETYEYVHNLEDGTPVKAISQQVSHHPPITAVHVESDGFVYQGSVNPKIKFWGRSIEISPEGMCRVHLKSHNENYVFGSVSCSIHNIIVGKLWFEHCGPLTVKCVESGVQANLTFKQAGWFSNELHRFNGFICASSDKNAEKLRFIYGKWTDYIKSVGYKDYEKYMSDNQQKLFKIPDSPSCEGDADGHTGDGLSNQMSSVNLNASPNSVNNNSISSADKEDKTKLSKKGDGRQATNYTKSDSVQSFDIPNSRTLWRLNAQYLEEYYGFTYFTLKMNELTTNAEASLPKTDSRLRLDVRKLEEGDLDGAANEKQRLEDKQRATRAKDKRFKDPTPEFLWFDLSKVPFSKEKFYMYTGGYWEAKSKNPEKFPDIF